MTGLLYRLGVAIKEFGERSKLAVIIRIGLMVKGWAMR